jgi:hypothetical protein
MRVVIILTILIILVILSYYLAKNKETFFYNNLIQKEHIKFDETFAMTAFEEGNEEIKVYKYSVTPVMGSPRQAKLVGPVIGFDHKEVSRNRMNDAIKTKDSVTYVDNSLMVPYLFQIIKRIAKQTLTLQEQINQLASRY